MGYAPIGGSATAASVEPEIPASEIDALKVPFGRRVVFEGGKRVVLFEGSKKMVEFT